MNVVLQVSDMIEAARGGATHFATLPPERFQRDPQRAPVVVWNVIRHCNMTCPHCYAAASSKPAPTDLTTEEAMRLLDSLAGAGVKILIFSGGEPLLRPDLLFLIDKARRLGMRPHLSSNGVLIDEDMARRLAEAGVVYAGVSIDGPREFNDSYRGLVGGYDDAVRGLCLAKEAGVKTGLRLTLIRRNQEHLETIYELARTVNADRFYVSHLLYSGRGRNLMSGEDLSRSEARATLFRLFELAESGLDAGAATRVVTGSNDSDGPLLLRWLRERYGSGADAVEHLLRQRGGNSAGEGILNIDARGRVHPDQFWTSETLGDVREQSFSEILRHPLRVTLRERETKLKGRCASCAVRDMCRGSHRERALAAHGDMWAEDPACVLVDEEILATTTRVAVGEEVRR